MLIRADLNQSIPVVYLYARDRLDNAFDQERWKVRSLDEPTTSKFLIKFSKQTEMKELGSNNSTNRLSGLERRNRDCVVWNAPGSSHDTTR